jgi:hypothetical protein
VFLLANKPFIVSGEGKNTRDRAMDTSIRPLRSLLFAPGNHARRVAKALSLDADAVILDLEDAVAIAEKSATRAVVAAALERPRHGLLYVRVNAVDTDICYGDRWRSCSMVWTASFCQRWKAQPGSRRSIGCWRSWNGTRDCRVVASI